MQFKLTGVVLSKARPRFHNNRAILPKAYREWKDGAIHQLYMQRRKFDEATKPSEIHIIFVGKHSRQRDIDNMSGSIFDVLVQVNFLKNDNMVNITKMSAELQYSTDSPYTLIELI